MKTNVDPRDNFSLGDSVHLAQRSATPESAEHTKYVLWVCPKHTSSWALPSWGGGTVSFNYATLCSLHINFQNQSQGFWFLFQLLLTVMNVPYKIIFMKEFIFYQFTYYLAYSQMWHRGATVTRKCGSVLSLCTSHPLSGSEGVSTLPSLKSYRAGILSSFWDGAVCKESR